MPVHAVSQKHLVPLFPLPQSAFFLLFLHLPSVLLLPRDLLIPCLSPDLVIEYSSVDTKELLLHPRKRSSILFFMRNISLLAKGVRTKH